MPSYEASMRNLDKAKATGRSFRPWRSPDESLAIRRLVFLWATCRDSSRPSGRAWAKGLRISHTWLQRLSAEFANDPSNMWRLQEAQGDPTFAHLEQGRLHTELMRSKGNLRGTSRYRLSNQ